MAKEPRKLVVRKQLRKCPDCNYADGFHLMFKKQAGNSLAAFLICPQCSRSYDIGLRMSSVEVQEP